MSGAGAAAGGTAIAWIGPPQGEGRWGSPAELAMPLDERGLLLADGLFETVLVRDGRAVLLAPHLRRWREGAELLGLPPPPAQARVEELLAQAVQRSGITAGALRLNWSRGGGGRGLSLPQPARPRFWLQLTALGPADDAPLRLWISRTERRDPLSVLSRCKTFAYGGAIQARREALAAGADDALLLSVRGELSCASAANLLIRHGDTWLTPSLASGCLPGVMRGRALALGLAQESRLLPDQLTEWATLGQAGCLLLNSLGCRPAHSLEDQPLRPLHQEAAGLWHRLTAEAPAQAE
jgi:branched-subunit amino acid aminotransferase/4-amino-4-deoxychorismate lyase